MPADRPTLAEARAQQLTRYFGKICERHPEAGGERRLSGGKTGKCRKCGDAAGRAYYQRHKKRVAVTVAAYYQQHKELHKDRRTERSKAWHKRKAIDPAWRQRKIASRIAWRKRNLGHDRATKRARYSRDNKRIRAMMQIYRKQNRQQFAAYHNARRARKLNAPGCFTAADIDRLWNEQGGICVAPFCNAAASTIDHKHPLSRGGSNWPVNLQLMCGPCNSSKGTKTMDEWLLTLAPTNRLAMTQAA